MYGYFVSINKYESFVIIAQYGLLVVSVANSDLNCRHDRLAKIHAIRWHIVRHEHVHQRVRYTTAMKDPQQARPTTALQFGPWKQTPTSERESKSEQSYSESVCMLCVATLLFFQV